VHSELAQHVATGLSRQGCTVAFGVPGGGANLDVVGAFADHDIDFVLAHSETAACIMGATAGLLSESISAAVVTRGPGAASAVNGAAQATLDRQPLLLVTDTVPTTHRDRIPHQRIDQPAMLTPVCKASMTAGSQTSAVDIEAAAQLAKHAPAGCVHVDYDQSHPGRSVEVVGPQPDIDPAAISQAQALIASASYPVVILGVGAVPHAAAVRDAVMSFGAPTLATYQGVGIVPTEHRIAAGLFTNGASERPLLVQADLVVMIGVDMVEPIPAAWNYDARVISLSAIPEKDEYLDRDVSVVGDLDSLVPQVLVGDHQWEPAAGGSHNASVRAALQAGGGSDTFGPVGLTRQLAELVPSQATVTVDAGAHFLAIMPFWPATRPRQLLISNGLATMGYAVPAAIGAALARPAEPVVALTGDGGLGMCLAELETIARRQLPITVVVFNDATLSLIEIKQQSHHGGKPAVQYSLTDFAAAATAMGVAASVVHTGYELAAVLVGHDHASPLLIDARIDPAVYPHLISVTRG